MKKLDVQQSNMIAIILNTQRNPNENIDSFACRQGRLARKEAQRVGVWSSLWGAKASEWYGHLRRHLESPAGLALAFRDAKWLQGRRIKEQTRANRTRASLLGNAGWTATRVAGLGKPQPRWEEQVLKVQAGELG